MQAMSTLVLAVDITNSSILFTANGLRLTRKPAGFVGVQALVIGFNLLIFNFPFSVSALSSV